MGTYQKSKTFNADMPVQVYVPEASEVTPSELEACSCEALDPDLAFGVALVAAADLSFDDTLAAGTAGVDG